MQNKKRTPTLLFTTCLSFILLVNSNCKPKKQHLREVKEGTQVAITTEGVGEAVQTGDWLKLQVIQLYNDSVLRDSRSTGPEYQRYDSTSMTKESLKVFAGVHEGDSLSFRVTRDSAFPRYKPDFAKVGGYLITKVKVERILRSSTAYENDRKFEDSLFRSTQQK
jgi:hypothetical protein